MRCIFDNWCCDYSITNTKEIPNTLDDHIRFTITQLERTDHREIVLEISFVQIIQRAIVATKVTLLG
jgi:hypothetical protein